MKSRSWLNSMLSIISLVSSGRLVKKRIWLGGALSTLPPPPAWPPPWCRPPPTSNKSFQGTKARTKWSRSWGITCSGKATSSSCCCSSSFGFLRLLRLGGHLTWNTVKIVSNGLTLAPVGLLGRSTNVPFILAMMSESPRAKSSRIGLS